MLNRLEPLLKLICVALVAILLAKTVHRVLRLDPLGNATIPPLPTLTTNTPAKLASTNAVVKLSSTNAPTKPVGTNAVASTNSVRTNKPAGPANALARSHGPHRGGMGGMPMMMGGRAGGANLPAPIQAHIDHIKESEILGPFMRPAPMALLGIADDDVFLRAPDGQSGLVKEGKELGGVKILRIGINRVLVEQDGEKKELTLFDGAGGESLMPAEPDHATNATSQPKPTKETP